MNNPSLLKWTVTCAALIACMLLLPCVAEACPNCKSSVAHDSNGMALGFAWSIAFMLAVPVTIVSAWAIAIRKYLQQLR
ncbi:MAG: hypothetical protein GY819_16110 [Planctomycetaceae bacterium]|nr:hypothetical protein [Planctomycetaceae bacterium]MCP4464317.1 hypothetical protein [Planctomycetaceae bacterium]MDG1806668.1 hypothetical protein [Pirellulaceae bacterium]MDG2103707.1 hypothetical protein [Pirellulaceae bacterium]